MSIGNFLESAWLNMLYGNEAFTPPDTLYLGASLTNPLDDGSGITEPSGGGYSRQAIANNGVTWAAAAAGVKTMQIDVHWDQATDEWGTLTHAFIATALAGGTYYGAGELPVAKYVNNGARFSINASSWSITATGNSAAAYLKNAWLDHTFGKTPFLPPGNIYLGLSQTDPQSIITEPAGFGYGRVVIANNVANFPSTSNHIKNNGVAFLTAVATGSWGSIPYHFTADALTGGNLLHSALLDTILYPGVGDEVKWDVGAFEVQQT